MPDHYGALGLAPGATERQIREAYRSLARELHPDVHPEERKEWAARRFRELQEAYEVLRSPRRRRAYDESLGRQAGGAGIAPAARGAACFYHAGRTAHALCPACGRPLCAQCGDGTSACRVCRLSGTAASAATLPTGTRYSTFVGRVAGAAERQRRARMPAPWLRVVGLVMYPSVAAAAALAWVSFALEPLLAGVLGWAVVGGLTLVIALLELWLLTLPSPRFGRVAGIAWEALLVGGVLAWVLAPWLGDRFASSNPGFAEACYRRGALVTRGATLMDASNARCAAAWREIDDAYAYMRGERLGLASLARGYGEQFGAFIEDTKAPSADFVGARAALARAEGHFGQATALRPAGPGPLGSAIVKRLEARVSAVEAANASRSQAEGEPDAP